MFAALCLFLLQQTATDAPQAPGEEPPSRITAADLAAAARVTGAAFSDDELRMMIGDVAENLASYERIRELPLDNAVFPSLFFLPALRQTGPAPPASAKRTPAPERPAPERPADLESLAFADIQTLHAHVAARTVSCVELAETFLARLKRLDPKLHCVITLTEERALEQARALDRELERGESRGLLHGIPWVAKDLLAVRGQRTTWGAKPFEHQGIDLDAAVVERLDAAGAVLIAKVSLGALAWGDVWFGGQTRNPWNLEQGSSGSSAGSAAAVAAGCAPFAIGSETLGSIVSPSHRCGNSSLRPTFGRVSRHGAMALAWSMDKLGPLCRSAQDAAIVFDAIHGADARDPTTVSLPFDPFAPLGAHFTVGFPQEAFEDERFEQVLIEVESTGVTLVPIELPEYPVSDMVFVLSAEAGAAFDQFSRSDRDDELVRQERNAWPNVFRVAQLIPAVDYLRANRLRTLLIRDFEAMMSEVDAIVHPSYYGDLLAMTNLTGHPTFVAPCGFDEDGMPFSISFTGRLYGETELMALARAWQGMTEHHRRHPRF